MPFPNGHVQTESIPGTYKKFLIRDFVWTDGKIEILVPAEKEPGEQYISDGASIPRVAWRVIGTPWGPYSEAAIVHDWLYSDGWRQGYTQYTKEMADKIFLAILDEIGIGAIKRRLMYRAVRMFGRGWWTKGT